MPDKPQMDIEPVPTLSRSELRKLSDTELAERSRKLRECLRVGERSPEEEAKLRKLDGIVFLGTREWRIADTDLRHMAEVACLQKRAVSHVNRESLEKMGTKRLLSRLKALRRCIDSLGCTEFTEEQAADVEGILFKESDEWKTAFRDVKDVLATREHIPRRAR